MSLAWSGKTEKKGRKGRVGLPVLVKPLLLPLFSDLGGSNTLIVAVVPFSDVGGDRDASVGVVGSAFRCTMLLPWERVMAADVQELKRSLGA